MFNRAKAVGRVVGRGRVVWNYLTLSLLLGCAYSKYQLPWTADSIHPEIVKNIDGCTNILACYRLRPYLHDEEFIGGQVKWVVSTGNNICIVPEMEIPMIHEGQPYSCRWRSRID